MKPDGWFLAILIAVPVLLFFLGFWAYSLFAGRNSEIPSSHPDQRLLDQLAILRWLHERTEATSNRLRTVKEIDHYAALSNPDYTQSLLDQLVRSGYLDSQLHDGELTYPLTYLGRLVALVNLADSDLPPDQLANALYLKLSHVLELASQATAAGFIRQRGNNALRGVLPRV